MSINKKAEQRRDCERCNFYIEPEERFIENKQGEQFHKDCVKPGDVILRGDPTPIGGGFEVAYPDIGGFIVLNQENQVVLTGKEKDNTIMWQALNSAFPDKYLQTPEHI